jgi:group I intron endonuclease
MHVYAITNKINQKLYIGQHGGEDLQAYLRKRMKAALRGANNSPHLYNAFRKYGENAFEICSLVNPIDKPQMDALEIFFIRTFETQNPDIGYNLIAGGGGALGYLHTDEEKAHMSEVMTGREVTWGDKISAAQKGRPLTPEHIAALKAGQKGCKKPPRSPEHLRKIGENKKAWWAKKKAAECQIPYSKTV